MNVHTQITTASPIANAADVYLTAKEAAAYRRLAEITLRKERMAGAGPTYIKSGRRVFYRKSDIDNYMRARTVEPRKAISAA